MMNSMGLTPGSDDRFVLTYACISVSADGFSRKFSNLMDEFKIRIFLLGCCLLMPRTYHSSGHVVSQQNKVDYLLYYCIMKIGLRLSMFIIIC